MTKTTTNKVTFTDLTMAVAALMALIVVATYGWTICSSLYRHYKTNAALDKLNAQISSDFAQNNSLRRKYHELNALIADINMHEKMELEELRNSKMTASRRADRQTSIKTFAQTMREDFTDSKQRLFEQYAVSVCRKQFGKKAFIGKTISQPDGITFTVYRANIFGKSSIILADVNFNIADNKFAAASQEQRGDMLPLFFVSETGQIKGKKL